MSSVIRSSTTDYPPVPKPKYKLTVKQVLEIRALKGHAKRRELAARFGVSKSNISAIWQRRNWSGLPPADLPMADDYAIWSGIDPTDAAASYAASHQREAEPECETPRHSSVATDVYHA